MQLLAVDYPDALGANDEAKLKEIRADLDKRAKKIEE